MHGVKTDCRRVAESRCRVNSSFQSRNWVKIVFQRAAILNPRKWQMNQKHLSATVIPPSPRFIANVSLPRKFDTKGNLAANWKSGYRSGKPTKLLLDWTNKLQRFAPPRLPRVLAQMLWKYSLDCPFRRMRRETKSRKCSNCARTTA